MTNEQIRSIILTNAKLGEVKRLSRIAVRHGAGITVEELQTATMVLVGYLDGGYRPKYDKRSFTELLEELVTVFILLPTEPKADSVTRHLRLVIERVIEENQGESLLAGMMTLLLHHPEIVRADYEGPPKLQLLVGKG